MTVLQLFYRTILRSYETLNREGKIANPWPGVESNFIRLILMLQNDKEEFKQQGNYIKKSICK